MFRSSPPGGTAGTTLPPQKVEFPFRPAPAFRPVFKASPETHTRPHLPPAERRKTATPARTSPLNARLPRTALHASYGVMAAPLSPAAIPPRWQPLPPPPSLSSPLLFGPGVPPLRLSANPGGPQPCPSALLPHACCPRFPPRSFSPLLPLCAIPSALVTPFPLRCTPPPRAAPRFRRAPPTKRREAATAKAAAASLRQKGRKE